MKGKREHRVPLAPVALDLLRALPREDDNDHVFIGPKAGQGLGGQAPGRLLVRISHTADGSHKP